MYFIIAKTKDGEQSAFYSDNYHYENNYAEGMIVVDIQEETVTFDGVIWHEIQTNHL